MRAITWVLVHWPNTVALAKADREIRKELLLRADCGVANLPSPHQPAPSAGVLFLLALAALALLCLR